MLLAAPCVVLVEVAKVVVWTHDRTLARRPSACVGLSDDAFFQPGLDDRVDSRT